jgi:ABC-type dipeptide/oligopeptide/nickel transport system permease subunit
VGHAILTFASLSFLGLSPPPEVPEWGSMIAAGRNYLDQWWIATFPGLAILSLTIAFNVVGDSLRGFLDRACGSCEGGDGTAGRRMNCAPELVEGGTHA